MLGDINGSPNICIWLFMHSSNPISAPVVGFIDVALVLSCVMEGIPSNEAADNVRLEQPPRGRCCECCCIPWLVAGRVETLAKIGALASLACWFRVERLRARLS